MIYDAFFLFVKIFRAILSCLPRIYRECLGTVTTLTQTPLLIGDQRRKDTGGAGRGQGAEIGGVSQGAKIGDDDPDPRSGDTRTETDTGGGPDLETEGPDQDLCLPRDLEMKGPGRAR